MLRVLLSALALLFALIAAGCTAPAEADTSPTPRPSTPTATPVPHVHVVVRGDTLARIALQYESTVSDLAAANNISNPARIYVGQELVIPGIAGAAAMSSCDDAAAIARDVRALIERLDRDTSRGSANHSLYLADIDLLSLRGTNSVGTAPHDRDALRKVLAGLSVDVSGLQLGRIAWNDATAARHLDAADELVAHLPEPGC